MLYGNFKESVELASARFKTISKDETIRIVSHLDADGISACSILIHALNLENRKYSVSVVRQLDLDTLMNFAKEDFNVYVFADLGSGQISAINEHFSKKQVFVLDHHVVESDSKSDNVVHVNPHLFGIDGSKELSGSGVVFFFAYALDPRNKAMAHIAVIGAIGDVQEDNGFSKLNNEILEYAIEVGTIKVVKGLKFFGAQTKPLHKLLEYSTDMFIPGVTGSETGAIHFLQQMGINPQKENGWKKIGDLTSQETKQLITSVIMKRVREDHPEDILGSIYILDKEKEGSPLRDAREYSTLLNACGRLTKASIGVGVCLGDKEAKKKALALSAAYKKEIINALQWFHKNKDSEFISIDDNSIIINAQDNILGTIAGTLASILSKSKDYREGTLILSVAHLDSYVKVSLRVCGDHNSVDLREIVKKITNRVGGEAGGHCNAAGAIIPLDKEEAFIKAAKEILGSTQIEEPIL